MKINSHVQIPNVILKQFRDETSPEKKVCYLDCSTGEIQRTSSKRLGTKRGYYSEIGEKFWNETIETSFSSLVFRILSFCNNDNNSILLTDNDIALCKRYVKSSLIRRPSLQEDITKNLLTSNSSTDQENHDLISSFGMNTFEGFDRLLDEMDVNILINKTETTFVIPQNCFYYVSFYGYMNIIAPISPKSALLFMPKEQPKDSHCAIINDPLNVEEANICALIEEFETNCAFVAANNDIDLKKLQPALINLQSNSQNVHTTNGR